MPWVVSCSDILVLATRDGIVLAGGPYYPVLTGRRDSKESFFDNAMAEIPQPNGNISEILRLFLLRGFDERETGTLLGGHNIVRIGCEFIRPRLSNFSSADKALENLFSADHIRNAESARWSVQPLVEILNTGLEREQHAAIAAIVRLLRENPSKALAVADVEMNAIDVLC